MAHLHFITGKGGVGKSAVSAALALSLARKGRRVLLVELRQKSYFAHLFPGLQGQFYPQGWGDSLGKDLPMQWSVWTGTECLRDYALHLLKVPTLVDWFLENSVSRSLIQVAPGLTELSLLGKATSHFRRVGPAMPYQDIVVDAFATGHFMSLLKAPQALGQVVSMGPMGEQSRAIDECLRSAQTIFHCVALPTEYSLQESSEILQFLKNNFQKNAYLWINQSHDLQQIDKNTKTYLAQKKRRQCELQNSSLFQSLQPEKVFHIPMIYNMHELKVIQQISDAPCVAGWSPL